jgi:hypothetical protein
VLAELRAAGSHFGHVRDKFPLETGCHLHRLPVAILLEADRIEHYELAIC